MEERSGVSVRSVLISVNKQATKFTTAKIKKKKFCPRYAILIIHGLAGKNYELPHQDLYCLHIRLFSSVALKVLAQA